MNYESSEYLKVHFLTKYNLKAASSRLRASQYFPGLKKEGISCRLSPLFDDNYLQHLFQTGEKRLVTLIKAVVRRLSVIGRIVCNKDELVVIQTELFPYCPAIFEKLFQIAGIRYILDYDDALFHQYDQHNNRLVRRILAGKIASIMKHAEVVIAGNPYIADYAVKSGAKKVEIIPTVVDLERYPVRQRDHQKNAVFTIGWIGSPSTSKYLKNIIPSLAEICSNGKGRVVLIGSGEITLPGIPVEIFPWEESSEIDLMHCFDVGIMPLSDDPWERGKCGFKLIQYMACGLPVIASPVGVNTEIVEEGKSGFLPKDQAGWIDAFKTLRDNRETGISMGARGRHIVEQKYCLQVTAPRVAQILQEVSSRIGAPH